MKINNKTIYFVFIPIFLRGYVKEFQNIDEVEKTMMLVSKSGNDKLEIWFYGSLFTIKDETFSYISKAEDAPVKIVARDPLGGEEIIIFDGGAKCGYDDIILENRSLQRYNIPASKLVLSLYYNIQYDSEKEDYDFDGKDRAILVDGSTMSLDEVKVNGFDTISLSFIDTEGNKHTLFEKELA